MARRFALPKLVVATHNRGKAGEFATMLSPFGVKIVSACELGLPAPDETGTTFEENATLKALAATRASGLPALADDSGLSVHALDHQPGVYSADGEGPSRDAMVAMRRIQADLAKRVGMSPEVVRRLFTASDPNPTLDTVVRLAVALDCNLGLEPRVGRRTRKLAAREVRG